MQPVKLFFKIVILAIGLMILKKSLDYYQPDFQHGYLLDKKEIFDGIFKYGLYAHIVSIPFIFLTGTAQIFLRYEYKARRIHAIAGSIYAYLILFVSAPGAFILSFYAFGGMWAQISFFILTGVWFWVTLMGLKTGRKREITLHREYMTRSYVLTISAINLRILMFIAGHFFNFHGPQEYTIIAWLSWLPFLIGTEYWLRKQRKTTLEQA